MQMFIEDFLSTLNRTIIALLDEASSSEQFLHIAERCKGSWFDLPTSEIDSVSISDYVFCDDGRGYHKVTIVLREISIANQVKNAYYSRKLTSEVGPAASQAALSFDQVKTYVSTNKKSNAFTDECIIAVCWKESSFNPSAQAGTSTAKGLMQMTNPAVDTVNRITPAGVHFDYADMLDPAKAIQCGTYYLQWCSDQTGGDKNKALDKYAGVSGYSIDVIKAENCLLAGGKDPMTCLRQIHPFMIEREERRLNDDSTGRSRFSVTFANT